MTVESTMRYPDADRCPASLGQRIKTFPELGMEWDDGYWKLDSRAAYVTAELYEGQWSVTFNDEDYITVDTEAEACWLSEVAIAAAHALPKHPADVGFVGSGKQWTCKLDAGRRPGYVDLRGTTVDQWVGLVEQYVHEYPDTDDGRVAARLDAYQRAGVSGWSA